MTPKRPFLSASVRPGGFVDIVLMLALAGTWLGLLGPFHWALDLLSHFRWQYLLICVVGVAWSLALKRPRWIQALCLASLFVNAAALYLAKGDAAYAAIAGERLRVVSLNVFAGNPEKVQVLDYLRSTDADVFFLIGSRCRMGRRTCRTHGHTPPPPAVAPGGQLRPSVLQPRAAPVSGGHSHV